jgi:hypothetical protein
MWICRESFRGCGAVSALALGSADAEKGFRMAELDCADLGTQCTARRERRPDAVMAHAADAHPELLENMTPEMDAEIGGAIAGAFAD